MKRDRVLHESEQIMSMTIDPAVVRCDGADCTREALLPVALRAQIRQEGGREPQGTIAGWLFVNDGSREPRHYCPYCTPHYLKRFQPGSSSKAGA